MAGTIDYIAMMPEDPFDQGSAVTGLAQHPLAWNLDDVLAGRPSNVSQVHLQRSSCVVVV
jgi:hypothetical protein